MNQERDKSGYLYHITDQESLRLINKYGLFPTSGADAPVIHLCDEANLQRWHAILGKDSYLRVFVAGLNKLAIGIRPYGEVLYAESIPRELIDTFGSLPPCPLGVMSAACLQYLDLISDICVCCAKYAEHPHAELLDWIVQTIPEVLEVCRRLDWSVLSTETIHAHLQDKGNSGKYTLCDDYKGSGLKLWQYLAFYSEPALIDCCGSLCAWIWNNLSQSLSVVAGKWTGLV